MTNRNAFMAVGATCKRCGVVMGGNFDGIGWDRPAEIYAGTATGLCDKCMRESDYVLETFEDGAKRVSVAPTCPSWRRDRTTHIAYDNCPECGGKGYTRSSGTWGSSNASCKTCYDRYVSYPKRKFRRLYLALERENIIDYIESEFNAEAKTLRLTCRLKRTMITKYKDEMENDVFFVNLRQKYVNMYDKLVSQLNDFVDKEYPVC